MKAITKARPAALLVLGAVLAATAAEAISLDARALQGAFVEAVKRVRPAVVHLRVETTSGVGLSRHEDPWEYFFGPRMQPRRRSQGFGSGVLVSPDGLILTNHHVAGAADRITVKLADGREFPAKRVGTDEKTDICLLRIGGRKHPYAELGDSDKVEVGQWALAIGNPFGLLDLTVTLGIISARGRQGIVGGGGYEDFIQTDAAINPGNSGGPLVNIEGEIIGINTAIFSRSGGYMGVGFAVPSSLAKVVMDSLVKFGRVPRSWLGVGIQDVSAEVAAQLGLERPRGVVVTEVHKGSPAELAGFEPYDVVVSLDGREVENSGDLRNRVAHTPAGTEVAVGVLRDGRRRTLTAKLAPHPFERARGAKAPEEPTEELTEELTEEPGSNGTIGVSLTPVTARIARELGLDAAAGLLVTRVRRGSSAEEAGLRPGYVVLEANREKLDSLRDFARVRGGLKPGETLLLLVWDGRSTRLVGVLPAK